MGTLAGFAANRGDRELAIPPSLALLAASTITAPELDTWPLLNRFRDQGLLEEFHP